MQKRDCNKQRRPSSQFFIILPADPPPPPPPANLGMGSVGQTSTFSEHGHVAYQIKENHECSTMVARRPPPPPPDPGDWTKFNFSEHGHVAHQINGNHKCSRMFATIMPTDHPLTLWMGSKCQNPKFS